MVVVTEKGKIAAYELRIMEKHTDLDSGNYPHHRKKCPCCSTVIEEKPYNFVDNMNVYFFNADSGNYSDEVQIIANNFENAKKALGCGTKYDHADICDMLKEKNDEALHIVEEKHTHKMIPKSRW